MRTKRLNEIYLDVKIIMNHLSYGTPDQLDTYKRQLKCALILFPELLTQVDAITTVPALYKYTKKCLEEIKLEIEIEKEK